MLSFESTYKKLISSDKLSIFENLEKDETKDVYGYSLKTFIPQELELFNAFADAVISDANNYKKRLVASCKNDDMAQQYGVSLSILNDEVYRSVVNNFLNDSLLKNAHRNIYSPALIRVGVPALKYLNGNFVLQFRADEEFERLSEESNWKNNIIERLKFHVTDMFYDMLDWVDRANPLSKEMKDFFDWREEKVKYTELTNKLPELTGIFEKTTANNEVYVFEATIEKSKTSEINNVIHNLLLKCAGLFNIYYNILGVVKEETDNCFIFKLNVPLTTQNLEDVFKELKNAFIAYFSQEHKALMKSIKSTNSNFFSLPKTTFKWTEKKVYELQKKLPEVEGLFESQQTGYKFIATFDPTEGNDRKQLLKVLKMMTDISQAVSSNYGTVEEKVDITTNDNNQVIYSVENSSKWDFEKESERNNYTRAFYNAYNAIAPQFKLHTKYTARFKSKYEDMAKKLPELEGVFESKNKYVGFLKLTFKNISKEDMDIILKYGQESMEPHLFEIKPVSDSSLSFIEKAETEEAYEWFIKEIKNHLVEYKHSLASSLYHDTWTPIKNFKQAQAFVRRIFKDCEAKVMRSEYENLVKKLPELEGVFEHIEDEENRTYVLTVTFEDLEQNDRYMLEKLLLHRQKTTQYKSTITKTTNSLTYVIVGLMFEVSTSAEVQFERLFRKDIAIIYPNLTVQGSDQFLARIFKHFKYSCVEESMYHLTNKLPKLKGIFESTENTEEEFYFTDEETQAIERISEAVQRLFQNYEERLTALMKTTRNNRILIQDSHFNKYIAVTHLRNDLRLQIGKICKEIFQDDIGNKFGNNFYVLYERIFNKPLKGLDEVAKEGGVGVMRDKDGVFEIDFDTYDYNLNEPIIPAKLIEPIEIKSFLKRLYEEWIKAIIVKRPVAFPKMYLELRQEKLKYSKLKQKLPELEGVF